MSNSKVFLISIFSHFEEIHEENGGDLTLQYSPSLRESLQNGVIYIYILYIDNQKRRFDLLVQNP